MAGCHSNFMLLLGLPFASFATLTGKRTEVAGLTLEGQDHADAAQEMTTCNPLFRPRHPDALLGDPTR